MLPSPGTRAGTAPTG